MSRQSKLLPVTGARQRLLLVQPLVGIGDMVWHKPWIDHLAAHFDIILAAKPTAASRTLFHDTDGIVEWLDIDRSMRGKRGRHDGIGGLFRLVADFRAARADQVLVMHHSATYTLAARLAGIAVRWGYGIGGSGRWLNAGSFLGREARHERPTRKLGRFAKVNGFGLTPPVWRLSASATARDRARLWCRENSIAIDPVPGRDAGNLIIFGVGAMDAERQWPPACFAQLAASLHAAAPNLKILLMGAPSEMPIIEAVRSHAAAPAGLLVNMVPLDEAVALLEAARAYVGNDTSLLNIAAACGRPAIGIFAQTEPLDYSDNILPVALQDGRFGEAGAITRIVPSQVLDVVMACLESQEGASDR
ncbi:MAG: glycosyltransferase family 9 protein [Candidatus Puniceispirillaceae bacterium]